MHTSFRTHNLRRVTRDDLLTALHAPLRVVLLPSCIEGVVDASKHTDDIGSEQWERRYPAALLWPDGLKLLTVVVCGVSISYPCGLILVETRHTDTALIPDVEHQPAIQQPEDTPSDATVAVLPSPITQRSVCML